MNLDANPTEQELRQLIARCDDRAGDHALWVTKAGEVHLDRVPRGESPDRLKQAHPDMQVQYEIFQIGNEYVGPEAAEIDDWVSELFDSLLREWRKAKGKPGIAYIDVSRGLGSEVGS